MSSPTRPRPIAPEHGLNSAQTGGCLPTVSRTALCWCSVQGMPEPLLRRVSPAMQLCFAAVVPPRWSLAAGMRLDLLQAKSAFVFGFWSYVFSVCHSAHDIRVLLSSLCQQSKIALWHCQAAADFRQALVCFSAHHGRMQVGRRQPPIPGSQPEGFLRKMGTELDQHRCRSDCSLASKASLATIRRRRE